MHVYVNILKSFIIFKLYSYIKEIYFDTSENTSKTNDKLKINDWYWYTYAFCLETIEEVYRRLLADVISTIEEYKLVDAKYTIEKDIQFPSPDITSRYFFIGLSLI